MTQRVFGGIDYPLVKRHYDLDDYVEIGFSAVENNPLVARQAAIVLAIATGSAGPILSPYTIGTMSISNDPTQVADPLLAATRGWFLFTPASIGIPNPNPPPTYLPSFEVKDLLFHSDENCWLRFEGSTRVRHYIPADTYMRFHRRCFTFWVVRDTTNGVLRAWLEG